MFYQSVSIQGIATWKTVKRGTLHLASTACLLVSLASCAKEDVIHPNTGVAPVTNQQNLIPTYPLDWESIDVMPTPTCLPEIVVPWGSGASKEFVPEMAHDYKKVDGWELVYNTFNKQNCVDKNYFILYNKYRGVLRMYYYLSNTNLINTSNIIHKLGVEGPYASSSPIMNFAAQSIIDLDNNSSSSTSVEPFQIAPNTWYMFQYELAYDKNLSAQNFTQLNFTWPVNALQVTTVRLNGTSTGTVTGTLTMPGTNISFSPNLSNSSVNMSGAGAVNITGQSSAQKLLPALGSAIVSGVKKAITDGISGLVTNLLSGVFSKKPSAENVNLKVNTAIDLSGTLTSNLLVTSPTLAVPGYSQIQTTGYGPAYNQPLGVFYLSGKPIINQQKFVSANGQTLPTNAYSLSPDFEGNSAKLIINPAVLQIADIAHIQQEIAVYDNGMSPMISGRAETIGSSTYYFGSFLQFHSYAPSVVGLRISFDVVPKDGSSPVRLVKTFVPQVNEQVIVMNPGEDPF